MATYGKLIGSILGSALSWATLQFGFDMDPGTQATIVAGVSALLVWFIPNK